MASQRILVGAESQSLSAAQRRGGVQKQADPQFCSSPCLSSSSPSSSSSFPSIFFANSLITCTNAEDEHQVSKGRSEKVVPDSARECDGEVWSKLAFAGGGKLPLGDHAKEIGCGRLFVDCLKSCAKRLSAGMLFSGGRRDVGRTSIHSFVAFSLTSSCTAQRSLKASNTTFSSKRPRDMAVGSSQLLVSSSLLGQRKTDGKTFQREILELHHAQPGNTSTCS